jgi:hypothetical protein
MPLGAARFSFSGGTKPFDPNLGFLVTRYFGAMIGIEEGDPNNKAHWVMVLAFEQEPFLLTDI